MIHYLQINGENLVDASANRCDLDVRVCAGVYSQFLLDNVGWREVIVADFKLIQELREKYWQHGTRYKFDTPDKFLGRWLRHFADKYNMTYVTE